MEYNEIIARLKSMQNNGNIDGMARYGINTEGALGIPIYKLRILAKSITSNNELSDKLWHCGIHEAKILASITADPDSISENQIDKWVKTIDSWDVCDQLCNNLLVYHKNAYKKCMKWSKVNEIFIKRAGFTMMAVLAVHDKKLTEDKFEEMLEIIKNNSEDERNYVKKAVNWALRQIGKRSLNLHKKAIQTANCILKINNKTSQWIAKDALKELNNQKIIERIKKKSE